MDATRRLSPSPAVCKTPCSVRYLDAVRTVFSSAPKEHTDLLPEQIGMGPYDRAYKRHLEAGYRPGATK